MAKLADFTESALLERPLTYGSHGSLETGWCLLERHDARVKRAAHTEWDWDAPALITVTDSPDDVAPVLAAFGRGLNDALLAKRSFQRLDLEARLRALDDLLTDTAMASAHRQRQWGLMALDWLIRTYLPTLLRLTPALAEHADALANLAPLTKPKTDYDAVGALVSAARAAAEAAAWDAAWDAAGDAARAAAEDAVRSAAWDAAGDAARAAAWAAATEKLTPTVRELQESALALFEQMLAVRWRPAKNGARP